MASAPISQQFDLWSIDIDGSDFHVWNSVQQYGPAKVNQGCSLRVIIDLAKRKGYERAATAIVNSIFGTKSEFSQVGAEDNSINAMHFADHTTELFQG